MVRITIMERANYRKFIVVDDNNRRVEPWDLIKEPWVTENLVITSPDDIWFMVEDTGELYLGDSCGNFISCPGKYRAVFM